MICQGIHSKILSILGIGTGAGWVYPISFMLQTKSIQVTECNAVVKTVTDFFNQMCLPGALNSFYNPFGKYSWVCVHQSLLTLSQMTNFTLFQTEKGLQMTSLNLDRNGRKFSKPSENTVRKG